MSIQIFLTHASEDKAAVLELYERLKEKGYKPWLDKKDLLVGQNWREEIPKAIRNSQIVIACFSRHSVSKQGYVQREFRMALSESAQKPPGTIYLLPLKFDECVIPDLRLEQLGLSLKDIQWLDYWEPNGFKNLIRAIQYQFGRLEPATPAWPTFEYEVVTVDGQGQVRNRQKRQSECRTEDLGNGILLDMVRIPAGDFMMGSPDNEVDQFDSEGPQHRANVSEFWMGRLPVTQAQWRVVACLPKVVRDLNLDPSSFKGYKRPVESVSWDDAIEFCQRLLQKTGCEFRLPSEAEWEYACRAGTTTAFYFGETISTNLANYDGRYAYSSGPHGEYRKQTTPVGSFRVANAFGLYDMHGNVWEWCTDEVHEDYWGAPTDGRVWLSSEENKIRILRGGSWLSYPRYCRSASRNGNYPGARSDDIGFRVCCSAPRSVP